MAKQRGIVQLSGRVDNLCYYQQKRVRGGLVRRINLAMSERVKAGEEYANLRSANSFFGACSMVAAALLSLINRRSFFMTRADRQSYLTTQIYRHFRNTGRNTENKEAALIPEDAQTIPSIFNTLFKVRARDYFMDLPILETDVPIDATMVVTISKESLEYYLSSFNGSEVGISFYYGCSVYGSYYNSDTGKYIKPDTSSIINRETIYWQRGGGDVELLIKAGMADDTFSCYILRFDVVKFRIGGRPIFINSASTAHMVGISF
jgi:hypothetical protein